MFYFSIYRNYILVDLHIFLIWKIYFTVIYFFHYFVRQLIADIFNLPVVVIKNDQSGTLAAMFLAQLGLNEENSLDKIVKEIDDSKVYFPNQKNVQVYQNIIPIYREVEHDLDQSYDKIAQFQKKYPKLFE